MTAETALMLELSMYIGLTAFVTTIGLIIWTAFE